jgi:predicted enzyme involved in methoxymalonyl-ACP biosynthesis
MGRKVEETLVHIAVEAARRRGAARVEALFVPTTKNKPCLDFWVRSGLGSADKQTFVWDASLQYARPDVITLISEGVDS